MTATYKPAVFWGLKGASASGTSIESSIGSGGGLRRSLSLEAIWEAKVIQLRV